MVSAAKLILYFIPRNVARASVKGPVHYVRVVTKAMSYHVGYYDGGTYIIGIRVERVRGP